MSVRDKKAKRRLRVRRLGIEPVFVKPECGQHLIPNRALHQLSNVDSLVLVG